MRTFSAIWVFACLLCLFGMIGAEALWADELIPPSRTLEESAERSGVLSVFSEPPELDVYLDGNHVGKTPVWGKQVSPGPHILKIQDAERDISVGSGKILKIGLFKGDFVTLPEEAKQAVEAPSPALREPAERQPKKPAPETEKERDIERWQRFITLGHF